MTVEMHGHIEVQMSVFGRIRGAVSKGKRAYLPEVPAELIVASPVHTKSLVLRSG